MRLNRFITLGNLVMTSNLGQSSARVFQLKNQIKFGLVLTMNA